MFDSENAENMWWEYMVKTKVIAEKYKWKVVTPTTKKKAARAAGRHWCVMTWKGKALQYVRIHHNKGSVQAIWNNLKQCYNGVEHNNLQDVYAKVVTKIEDGPKDSDPLLLFSEKEAGANEEGEKGGGKKLKDNDEIMVLIRKPMRESKHYADCATALKVSTTAKQMEYKDIKKFYRDHWFENV
jgi:hypothetical protein